MSSKLIKFVPLRNSHGEDHSKCTKTKPTPLRTVGAGEPSIQAITVTLG